MAVTGLVRYKGPDIFGVPSLELSDSADGACEVLACFHDERAMASVREGDLVVVRGNYLTESGRFGVVLKMCDLVR